MLHFDILLVILTRPSNMSNIAFLEKVRSVARRFFITSLLLLLCLLAQSTVIAQEGSETFQHFVEPGDTWKALAWRYGVIEEDLRTANLHINAQRQPVIGRMVTIPNPNSTERNGLLLNVFQGGFFQLAARHQKNPWSLAMQNGQPHPRRPQLYQPVFIPTGSDTPRQLPPGFQSLEFSHIPAFPGQGLAIRGRIQEDLLVEAHLADQPIFTFTDESSFAGLVGTGAFFSTGDHEMVIQSDGLPLWVQPWQMVGPQWTFEEITLSGSAAAIDAESIKQERERLFKIWEQVSDSPQWRSSFQLPIEQYFEISSHYGARRSYNGGPFSSYHEGVDFSAYGGTPVLAPAAGTVVLAETLFVRGGAVIIDHGFGIYTGLYHMSEVLAEPGHQVDQGEIIGRVGSTGLSTGNHLHWDLLINGIWVDAAAWMESDTACWLLNSWTESC